MCGDVRNADSFPMAYLSWPDPPAQAEVTLLARLGAGEGNRILADAMARQARHPSFRDALQEPSAQLGRMHPGQGDASTLYSFGVGANGHPFHAHAGRRVFVAVSGGAGALLQFAAVGSAAMRADPARFVEALKAVEVPPDSLFCVRFGGGVWHRFVPARAGSDSPALFALSSHPDELEGALDAQQRQRVLADAADIPTLTTLLPANVADWLKARPEVLADVPPLRLALPAMQVAA